MKIGFLRFNGPIEIDYSRASVSFKGTDRRLGILEALVHQGHEVEIYTLTRLLPQKSKNLLQVFGGQDVQHSIDYSFLDHVQVKNHVKSPECDVLFIENGATNTVFSYKDVHNLYPHLASKGGVSYIYRTFDLLSKYEGTVIYFQHDASLLFPFGEALREAPDVMERDVYNLTKMAKTMDIIKNKKFKLVTTTNVDKLMRHYRKNKRANYSLFDDCCHVPTCYSENIDCRLKIKPNPRWDVTYVGTQDKFREKQLRKLLSSVQRARIIGDWETKVCDAMMMGKRGSHGRVYEFYNDSFVGVQVPNKLDAEVDNMTSRLIQIICAGSVALLSDIYTPEVVEEYTSKVFVVSSSEEVNQWVYKLKSINLNERIALNRLQIQKLKKWVDLDWSDILRIN